MWKGQGFIRTAAESRLCSWSLLSRENGRNGLCSARTPREQKRKLRLLPSTLGPYLAPPYAQPGHWDESPPGGLGSPPVPTRGVPRALFSGRWGGSVGWLLTQILVTGRWVGLRTRHWSEPSSSGPKAPGSQRSKSLQPEALSSAGAEPGGAGARLRGLDARPRDSASDLPPGAPSPTSRGGKNSSYRTERLRIRNEIFTELSTVPDTQETFTEQEAFSFLGIPQTSGKRAVHRLSHSSTSSASTALLSKPWSCSDLTSFNERLSSILFSDHHCAGHWLKKVTEASLSSWEQEEVKTNYKVN